MADRYMQILLVVFQEKKIICTILGHFTMFDWMVKFKPSHFYYWILEQSGHDFFHDYYGILKQSGHD